MSVEIKFTGNVGGSFSLRVEKTLSYEIQYIDSNLQDAMHELIEMAQSDDNPFTWEDAMKCAIAILEQQHEEMFQVKERESK